MGHKKKLNWTQKWQPTQQRDLHTHYEYLLIKLSGIQISQTIVDIILRLLEWTVAILFNIK